MKKFLLIFIAIILTSALSACSSKSKNNSTTGNVKITEENVPYIEKYEKSVQNYSKEMSEILIIFNNAVDGVYTKELSKEQFSNILTQTIDRSNELVTSVESENVEPDLFESQQQFILLVNRTHQLLLDAIDMANNPDDEIDKELLRTDYLAIKTDHATFINDLKVLGEELEKGKSGK